MTTKQQAEICVQRGLDDDEIVAMTDCHPECVRYIRAWAAGERVEHNSGYLGEYWDALRPEKNMFFREPARYRIAPRLIRATAELPDGRTVEVEWPEPVREALEYGQTYWVATGDNKPFMSAWDGTDSDHERLLQGRIFRTREAALQHDRAMIKLNGGEVE